MIAVDLGATNLRVALFHGERMIASRRVATPREGSPGVVAETIVRLAKSILRGERPDAVGIASIGPLDVERGWVVNTPNNPLRSFPLKEPIEEGLGASVYLYNDCVAAVWGEKVLGRGSNYRDLGYITISTGIGGGFIVDGRLILGRRGNAHEVGHMVIDYTSQVKCGCGGRGHWEALASGSGLPRLARLEASLWRGNFTTALELAREGRLDSKKIYSLARAGDPFALHLVDKANRIHAAGLASVAAVYDPEAVFLGGSVFLYNSDLMLPGIEAYLREYAIWAPSLHVATFGQDAVLYGAAAVALKPPR